MLNYYDAVLGLIPLSVGGITVALLWVGVTQSLAVSAGAVVGAVLVGHAMFIRAPVSKSADADASSARQAGEADVGEYSAAD